MTYSEYYLLRNIFILKTNIYAKNSNYKYISKAEQGNMCKAKFLFICFKFSRIIKFFTQELEKYLISLVNEFIFIIICLFIKYYLVPSLTHRSTNILNNII